MLFAPLASTVTSNQTEAGLQRFHSVSPLLMLTGTSLCVPSESS